MDIKYRIGIMPGPWQPGRDGAEFLWTLCDFLERSGIDSLWLSDRLSSPVPVPEVMTTRPGKNFRVAGLGVCSVWMNIDSS